MPNGTVSGLTQLKVTGSLSPKKAEKMCSFIFPQLHHWHEGILKLSYELQDGRDGRVMATELNRLK